MYDEKIMNIDDKRGLLYSVKNIAFTKQNK